MKKRAFVLFSLLFSLLLASPYDTEIDHLFKITQKGYSLDEYLDKDDVAEGVNADIFFVKDRESRTRSVIKMINTSPEELSKEIQSMRYIERLFLKKFHTPKVLSVKKIEEEEQTLHLISMNLAPGDSLNRLIQKGQSLVGEERERHIETLYLASEKVGEALGELHRKTAGSKKEMAPLYKSQKKIIIEGFYQSVKKYSRSLGITPRQARKLCDELLNSKLYEPISVVHNDPHPGNIFFDVKSGRVTFIDLANMGDSLNWNKGGPAAFDYVYALCFFQEIALFEGGLTYAEVDELTRAFNKGYKSQFPLLTDEIIAHYETFFYMDLIFCFYNFQADSPRKTEQVKRFAEFAKGELLKRIV